MDYFQKYVDTNEALIEAIDALEQVAASKMPGVARAIAIKAIARLRPIVDERPLLQMGEDLR